MKEDHKSVCQGGQTRKITLRWQSCGGVKSSQKPECIAVAAMKGAVAKAGLVVLHMGPDTQSRMCAVVTTGQRRDSPAGDQEMPTKSQSEPTSATVSRLDKLFTPMCTRSRQRRRPPLEG